MARFFRPFGYLDMSERDRLIVKTFWWIMLFAIWEYAPILVNPLVPEGSYRHILWNYLLTRQFGAEFAKKVTDAHEIGDREGESDAIHRVDFHNNAIGIRYALEGIPEAEVLPRVLSDRNVVPKN